MNARANPDAAHQEIIELLPDYATGSLGDAELDEVASHLEECASCRLELRQILQTIGILSEQPALNPSTRERFLARARGQQPSRSSPITPPATPTPTLLIPEPRIAPEPPRQLRPAWQTRFAIPAALAAAAILLLGYGLSTRITNLDGTEDALIAGIIAEAPFFPLTDGDLTPPAAGILFAEGDASRAVLLARGLPPLPALRQYQVWLFTDEGERVSGGLFTPDADGRAEVLIATSQPIAAYAAIAVSAEPAGGSPAPTSPLALGGWID